MPGKRSQEILKDRRQRALDRGYLKSRECDSFATASGVTRCSIGAQAVSNRFDSDKIVDPVFSFDPWAPRAPPVCRVSDACSDAMSIGWNNRYEEKPDRVEPNLAQKSACSGFSELMQAHHAALKLIEQQNNTIALLTSYFGGSSSASCYSEWGAHATMSGDFKRLEEDLVNVRNEVRGLARSLPSVVQAGIEKSSKDSVTADQFGALEALVREVATTTAHEIETSIHTIRDEFSNLRDRCAHSCVTIVKKQIQQDSDIEEMRHQLSQCKSPVNLRSVATSSGAGVAVGRSPVPLGDCIPCESSETLKNSKPNTNREMSLHDFLIVAAAVRHRLTHLFDPATVCLECQSRAPEITQPLLMIADGSPESFSDSQGLATSECTSELPSEESVDEYHMNLQKFMNSSLEAVDWQP